ncbi:MAG TPA: magnesium transporter CorA family protein [Terriglobia bacterium]|jgi:magnesium transporter|nr:magnesium transporter CorA family protein [Terriglobia bacterium]
MPHEPPTSNEALLESLAVIPGVRWFHLSDPSSPALDHIAEQFSIHPLQVEDCRHRRQTPRVEEHDKYTFIVIKALAHVPGEKRSGRTADASGSAAASHERGAGSEASVRPVPQEPPPSSAGHLKFEDFDIFLGPDYVFSVSSGESRLVAEVAARVRMEPALHNPDIITHALVDAAVDQYLPALDHLGDFINRLEDRVIHNPAPATLREIFRLKRMLLDFRRVATAMRETVNALVRRYDIPRATERKGTDRDLRIYYRDVYEHVVRVIDFIETYRDLLTGSLDIYLSAVANRTNEVMKILTLWGTIAMPLLVLTSFYGMNIRLPLQNSPYALIPIGLIMVVSTVIVWIYIRRKHWM